MKRIILASKSPRREELLQRAQVKFEIIPSKYREEKREKFDEEFIKKVSYCKAQDVAQSIDFDAVLISADTMVILDSVCLVKPRDFDEAFYFLKKLSGKTHEVKTAITVLDKVSGKSLTRVVTSKVKFRPFKDSEIKDYIEKYAPYDKAGAYGIQDFINEDEAKSPPEGNFVQKIEGSFENIMGLDTETVLDMLNKINA